MDCSRSADFEIPAIVPGITPQNLDQWHISASAPNLCYHVWPPLLSWTSVKMFTRATLPLVMPVSLGERHIPKKTKIQCLSWHSPASMKLFTILELHLRLVLLRASIVLFRLCAFERQVSKTIYVTGRPGCSNGNLAVWENVASGR